MVPPFLSGLLKSLDDTKGSLLKKRIFLSENKVYETKYVLSIYFYCGELIVLFRLRLLNDSSIKVDIMIYGY